MKNLYHKQNFLKIYLVLFVFLTLGQFTLKAQPYTFTAASGTFTPVSGGTALASILFDDVLSSSINLGFNFKFNGKVYSQARISSNGFICFKTSNFYESFYVSDSSSIVPLGGDGSGVGGTATYITEGTAPNRIFTMQWLNWKWNYQATAACISFQVKLYETSNRIEFIYRQEAGALNSPSAYIGLSFQSKDSYMYLTNSGTTPEIKTSSPVYVQTKPATGQVYRFDPIIKPEPSNHVTNFASTTPGKLQVQWTDATGTNVPSRYLIKVSNVSFAAITSPVDGTEVVQDLDLKDGTGTALVDLGKQKFNGWTDSVGNTTYYMKIFPLSNFNTYCNYKTDGVVPQLQINLPFYEAFNLSYSNLTTSSVSLQWIRGSYSNCAVFVKENGVGKASPLNNTTYTGDAAFGNGTQIGTTGWFCVYNGTGNTVNLTGLKTATSYGVHVLGYNGAAGAQQYSTIENATAYKTITTNLFSEVSTTLTGVGNSGANWVDYDNDNDLDIIIAGSTSTGIKTILYRNDAGTFVNSGVIFPDVKNASVSWADYDNDGFADLLLMGLTSTIRITKIFHNNGNGSFTELAGTTMPGMDLGNASWADYNNDGLVDFFVCGYDGAKYLSQIYRNAGSGTFIEQTNILIKGIRQAASAWADFDKDGFMDLLTSGFAGNGECVSKIFKNTGNGNFAEVTGLALPAIANSSIDVGDYDSDGDPDILFTGNYYVSSNVSKIYRNDGNFVFTAQNQISLVNVRNGSQHFGDYDNDGDLDIIVNGLIDNTNGVTKVYRNNNGSFEDAINIVLPDVSLSSVAWGDYDNDNDLDILITGQSSTGYITKIYKNESTAKNTVPGVPAGLTSTLDQEVALQWNIVAGDATPSAALTYNVRVGKTSGAGDILAPLSSNAGIRRIVAPGNAREGVSFILKNLKKGTYYWSVQAVDNNFAGGAFAAEQSFVFSTEIQASNLSFNNISSSSVKYYWNRGNSDKCAVFVKEGGSGTANPVNNITYIADVNFGSGGQIGTSGWFCVYNGNAESVTVNNLKSNTTYQVHVVEYSGAAGSEAYYTTTSSGNPAFHTTHLFTEQSGIAFQDIDFGSVEFGDYDNDGDLDVFLAGQNNSGGISKIYRNNGNNTFTDIAATITNMHNGDVAWGDYDNDGDLDILITGYATGPNASKIYRNNAGTFVEQTGISLVGVAESSVDWGDYDNDGDLDILLTGNTGSKNVSLIYRNNGDNTFSEQSGISLPGIYEGSANWGDYDNDGDLDILLTGYSSTFISKIYKNNGNNTFSELTGISLEGVWRSDAAWGDYDNDGDLDIILTGAPNSITKIYNNNGNSTFTQHTGVSFTGISSGSVKWGDYDNDGHLDILLSGWTSSGGAVTKIYRNNGDKSFTEQLTMPLPGLNASSVTWGDYDNDGDLDIFLTGYAGSSKLSRLFRNDILTPNLAPAAPANLSNTVNGGNIELKWDDVTSDNTPANGMVYNVRVGKSSGASDVVTPMSSNSGTRRIVAMGNAQKGTSYNLINLKKGTYYWSVQAIDNSFAGGAFSPEQSFVNNLNNPAQKLTFSEIKTTSVKCSWSRGNGDKCILFVKENGTGIAEPLNNTTYAANSVFKTGTQIGTTGWYCVYNGTGDSITISGLKAVTSYAFHVIEYEGTTGVEKYYTEGNATDHAIQITHLFCEQKGISLANVYRSSVAWGDYDNDGDLDILLTGLDNAGVSRIYRNDGNGAFTEQTAITLANIGISSAAWGDYDNDGDLDILLSGYRNTNDYISKIYRNNGNSTFSEQTGISLTGVYSGTADWGDYDNDGDLDILLIGESASGRTSKIYTNNSNNTFTEEAGISITGVQFGASSWADYDNDGDLDILLTGSSGTRISMIYKNNGNKTFTSQSITLPGVWESSVAWGDYDNDGFLDFVLSGTALAGRITKIYRNNGNNTFSEQTGIPLPGVGASSVAWGDYDNDGDLDLLITGETVSGPISKIYRNNGDNTFSDQPNLMLQGVRYSSVAWGDYDNDGDLDILLTGTNGSSNFSRIYKNEIATPNSAPAAPDGLNVVKDQSFRLQWNPVTTDATPQKGLTYNVRVGSSSGASNIVSSMAANSSFRRLPESGNAGNNTFLTLKNLNRGTYYWSVQAIDNNFAGGAFAAEQTFVNDTEFAAKEIKVNAVSGNSVKCSWTRGNGTKCLLLASENGTGVVAPVNNTTYSASKTFGSGTQIGAWFCLYNGDLDTATIINLKSNTEYRFQVIEYEGNAGAEFYFTAAGINNPVQYTPVFIEQTQIALTGLSGNTNAWGDYDNDGDLDLVIGGYTGTSNIAEIYKNNGDNTFTKAPVTISNNYTFHDLQWGDYDNDGDLDLLALSDGTNYVYENKGDGTFITGTSLPTISGGTGQWADLNNDGYKDIIFTTMAFTRVLKNNKDKTFSQVLDLPGVSNSPSLACGDYDNDGDLDLLLAGLSGSNAVTKVFRNDGDFIFTEQTGITLPGISNCAVEWADMDNDGDLDIVISGADYYFYTKIFDNNGNNTFTEIAGTPFKELYRSSLAIADYDNDGYRDLLVSGSYNGDDYYTILYRNNGNKTYSEVKTVSFPGIQYGSLKWGDYDNDNDPDLFICGKTATGRISKIIRNNGIVFNTKPSTVGTPSYSLNGNDLKITWNKPSDAKTASAGLSYNLYVYETSKSGFVKSGEAFPYNHTMNGRKLIASFGDIQYSSAGYTIKGLSVGDYKISIQAVDAGMLGGSFSNENSFSILDLSSVSVNLVSSYIINTKSGMQFSINSTDGVNGIWTNCYGNQAYINFSPGGYDVWIRQADNTKNKRKVATIASQSAAPAFTINYDAETTAENIPATVEYSYSSNFSNVTNGTDAPVSLVLGNTLYIRTKATASALASAVQNLVIPARPAAPAFTIDFATEKIVQNLTSSFEYSTSSSMSNAVSGTGMFIGVTPGQNLYIRTKATASAFASGIQTLIVPLRREAPFFSINYFVEAIGEGVLSTIEYSVSSDMSNAVKGNGTQVPILPGQSLYFRIISTASAFSSEIFKLTSSTRPATPSFGIDFLNETTSGPISNLYEYSRNQDMSNSITGYNAKIKVTPGEKVYFVTKATYYEPKSLVQTLEVPARAGAPANLITEDGANTFDWEYVPGFTEVFDYEYSTNGGNSWVAVNAKPMIIDNMNISAGNFKLRVKATSTRFRGQEAVSNLAFTTGIIKLGEIGVRMYPNPATDILYLENLPAKSVIYIFNLNGKLVMQKAAEEEDMKISVMDLPQGLYVLKIRTPQQEYQSKFTKQ